MLEPGSFLWSSPHGYQFLRDHHGTLDVSRDRRWVRGLPEAATWSRLIARFARCSTTGGCGRLGVRGETTLAGSRPSLRSLLDHLWSLAARPPWTLDGLAVEGAGVGGDVYCVLAEGGEGD